MVGIKFKCIIACTGQFNGYNTYHTYFFAPSKQNYEEIIANDTSLNAWNKGMEKLKEARSKYLGGNVAQSSAGGYGAGYGAPQQQGYGNAPKQQVNNFAGAQSFGNAQQTQTMQNVAQMQSMQGVATNTEPQPLDDDLPF